MRFPLLLSGSSISAKLNVAKEHIASGRLLNSQRTKYLSPFVCPNYLQIVIVCLKKPEITPEKK